MAPTFGERLWKRLSIQRSAREILGKSIALERRASKIQPELFAKVGRADSFSECRHCLEPGVLRACCGNYYCDECFFKQAECLSCGADVAPRGWKLSGDPANAFDLGCAFFITFVLTLVLISLPSFLLVSHISAPETLHGFVCDGAVLPQCDRPACIEFGDRSIDEGMAALSNWTSCTNETTSRIRAQSCIFDTALFERTDGNAGWDMCIEDNGVSRSIVIEDGFERPEGAPIRDSFWDTEETSGDISGRCSGGGGSSSALTFSGSKRRIATTVPVDVVYGGSIEFLLKYPKGLEDDCATFYSGEVTLSYRLFDENASTWSPHFDIITYSTGEVKGYQAEWFPVSQAIPDEARSRSTRFSWRQNDFDERYDHFALDNVAITSNFAPGWDEKEVWQARRGAGREQLRMAQCCFDTFQCGLESAKKCDHFVGWDGSYEVTSAQDQNFLILVASLTSIFRFVMTVVVFFLHHGFNWTELRKSLHAKIGFSSSEMKHTLSMPEMDAGNLETPKSDRYAHHDTFHLRRNFRWQMIFLFYALLVLAFMCVGLLLGEATLMKIRIGLLSTDIEFQGIFIRVCAFALDYTNLWDVARHVVCIRPAWMPKIHIEKRRNKLHLIHSRTNIETYDMVHLKDLIRFSKSHCIMMTTMYLIGVLPWATLSQVMGKVTLYLQGRPLHLFGIVAGCITWARVFFGSEVLIKLYLAVVQIYTPDESVRGQWAKNLFTADSLFIATYHLLILGTFFVVLWVTLHGFDPVNSGYIYSLYYGIAFLFGWVQGALQHAPVRPYYFLTDVAGDGTLIHFHKYDDWRSSKNCRKCSTIRSSDHWLMVFVDDHVSMTELLRGEQADD